MPAFKRPESVLVVVHAAAGRVLMLERTSPPRFWQSVTGAGAALLSWMIGSIVRFVRATEPVAE